MPERVCVFCGSGSGFDPVYARAAAELGALLAQRGIELVYGAGNVGLMGVLADSCLGNGGRVIGVIPKLLEVKELAHRGLTKLHVVGSMHERKALMADISDGFVALPGGYGTWDELCEVLTWSQLGIHRKACAVLNVNGYYDPMFAMADRAVKDGFLRAAHRDLLIRETDAGRLLDRLSVYEVPLVDKWLDRGVR